MDMYDEKAPSVAGFGRAVKGILFDPSTYVGAATFGAATAGSQALKVGIKEGVKQATKAGLSRGAKVGALEGAAYTAADNALRQSTRITAGQQDNFDFGQTAKTAGIGAAAGSVLGGTLGAIGGRVSARKAQEKIANIEEESLQKVDQKQTVEEASQEVEQDVAKFNRETAEEIREEKTTLGEGLQADIDLELSQKVFTICLKL